MDDFVDVEVDFFFFLSLFLSSVESLDFSAAFFSPFCFPNFFFEAPEGSLFKFFCCVAMLRFSAVISIDIFLVAAETLAVIISLRS